MKLTWRFLILAAELLMIGGGGVSLAMRFRETRENKLTVENSRWISVFFLCAGILFSLPTFISRDPAASLFCLFSVPVLYCALVTANQRIRWDAKGFWYRTAFRREIRYAFEDVRSMRPIGVSTGRPDLFVNAGGRRFLLDSTTWWQRFSGAYDDWRTRNKLPSWNRETQERFLARYHRHGPFEKKLDRVPYGRFLLWLYLISGSFLGVIGILGLATAKRPFGAVCCVVLLLYSVSYPIRYIYAVAHLDDKPRLIRKMVRGKILPDPDHPVRKVYRKKKK